MTTTPPHRIPQTFLSSAELRRRGLSRTDISTALATGHLERVRRGRYVVGGLDPVLVDAARHGGRLDCVSLLSLQGVFVLQRFPRHIQISPGASRLPNRAATGVLAHWRPTSAAPEDLTTDIVEALVQASVCQRPREALASIESAKHLGLLSEAMLAEVFARLPRRLRFLRKLFVPGAESGPETLVRLMLRGLGFRPELQARIPGVGRVDLVAEGWLIIECDSREFHASWKSQLEDRRRDLAAAAQGYVTLRLTAEDIMYRPETVVASLRGLLLGRRNSSVSGRRLANSRRAGQS